MTPYQRTKPTIFFRKKETDKWKKITLDLEGNITLNAFYSSYATITIFNSLSFLKSGCFIKIEIGGVIFYQGQIQRLFYANPSLVTSSLSLELSPFFPSQANFLENLTFNKGDSLKEIIPTDFIYTLKKNITFSENQTLEERALSVSQQEKLGAFSFDEDKNKFIFTIQKEKPSLKANIYILNEKISTTDIINIDILPNLKAIPNSTFSLASKNNAYFSKSEKVDYEILSSSLSFSSRRGAVQSIQAISTNYKNSGGYL